MNSTVYGVANFSAAAEEPADEPVPELLLLCTQLVVAGGSTVFFIIYVQLVRVQIQERQRKKKKKKTSNSKISVADFKLSVFCSSRGLMYAHTKSSDLPPNLPPCSGLSLPRSFAAINICAGCGLWASK